MTLRKRGKIDGLKPFILGTSGTVGFPGSDITWKYTAPALETCVDELHKRYRKGTAYREGGPLTIDRRGYFQSPSEPLISQIGLRWANTRFIAKVYGSGPLLPSPAVWTDHSTTLGSKGWRKFRPGKPVANVGQFIGELQRLPTIPFLYMLKLWKQARFFKGSGSEYLNFQFGWKPFVKDLQDMYHLTHDLDKRLAQLRRDNGKQVRRRGKVSHSRTIEELVESTVPFLLYPTLPTEFYAGPGKRLLTTYRGSDSWFSAKFRYFVPDIDTVAWSNRATGALFGLNPTPSLIWELLPWSWLLDWAFNIGDVIANMSGNAVESLVAHYAFIMEHQYFFNEIEETQGFWVNGSPKYLSAIAVRRWENKTRRAASPFGFGIVPGSLSTKQALILGALGLSRFF